LLAFTVEQAETFRRGWMASISIFHPVVFGFGLIAKVLTTSITLYFMACILHIYLEFRVMKASLVKAPESPPPASSCWASLCFQQDACCVRGQLLTRVGYPGVTQETAG